MDKQTTLLIFGGLLLATFVLGIQLSYNMGLYNAGSNLCNPLTFGTDQEGKYICFNKTLLEQSMAPDYAAYFELSEDFMIEVGLK